MTQNAFFCKTFQRKGHYVAEIGGDLTFACIELLRHEFSELRLQRPEKLILDCTGVTLLSSVGLGEFSRLIKWGLDNNCTVKIVCLSNHVVEVLEISGITEMISLYPTFELAINA